MMKFGLSNHPGTLFRYRPVLGHEHDAARRAHRLWGTSAYGGSGTSVSTRRTQEEVEKSLKLKLD